MRGRGPRLPRPRVPSRSGARRPGHGGQRSPAVRLLVTLAVAIVGFAAALALLATVRIGRTDVDGLSSAGLLRTNVLVAGTDSREGLTDEEVERFGTGRVGGERPDTIFLVSTDGVNAAMLAFPRDLYVPLCDGRRGRINAAISVGGPTCLVETVQQFSGLPVSHYLELDLAGFVRLVDAVGGVTMTLEQPLVDAPAGADLPAGEQELDGQQALAFVRARQAGGDLGRVERQQQFMQALGREIASPSTLLNPVRLWRTTSAGSAALRANRWFGPLGMFRMGIGVAGAGSDMPTHVVPAAPVRAGGAAVLAPQEEAARQLFEAFRDGSAQRSPDPVG